MSGRGERRDEGLQALRERVQPAGGGDRRRAAEGELGVHDRDRRQHGRAAQARLHPVPRRREHRVRGHLGAGAGGGRDGDRSAATAG